MQCTSGESLPSAQPRPATASGTFLRCITVNDVYQLDNYPRLASAIATERAAAVELDCVVSSHLAGDFLSPCMLTSLDSGEAMVEGANLARLEYICLGNHEMDLGYDVLKLRLAALKGKCVNSNVENEQLRHLPRYSVIAVGGRQAVVGGFLSDDPSIYPPSSVPSVDPTPSACLRTWEEAKKELGYTPDLFLPMTHQLLSADRSTASAVATHVELASRTPVILGGHEHEVYVERVEQSLIVKVGQNAENIGFVDIWWDAAGALYSRVLVVPAARYAEEPEALAFKEKQLDFLSEMRSREIAQLPSPMSSQRVRFEASDLASFLLSLVKGGMRKRKARVELAMVQGGAVRGAKRYDAGAFTMGALLEEFPFECLQAVVNIRGDVIAESVKRSRELRKPSPNFLHLDADCKLSGTHKLLTVDNEPFDPRRMYRVCIYEMLLTGLNTIEPLLSYVRETGQVPSPEQCTPLKELVLEFCMQD